ncbi:MAG TPA: hypothetical protein EYH59_03875 [Pyrodictium sp.]|nr:hypothetical protein [Pyrodictium sp.]
MKLCSNKIVVLLGEWEGQRLAIATNRAHIAQENPKILAVSLPKTSKAYSFIAKSRTAKIFLVECKNAKGKKLVEQLEKDLDPSNLELGEQYVEARLELVVELDSVDVLFLRLLQTSPSYSYEH